MKKLKPVVDIQDAPIEIRSLIFDKHRGSPNDSYVTFYYGAGDDEYEKLVGDWIKNRGSRTPMER